MNPEMKRVWKNLCECLEICQEPPLSKMPVLLDEVANGEILAVKYDMKYPDGTQESFYAFDLTRTCRMIDPKSYYDMAMQLKEELIVSGMFNPDIGDYC